MMTKHRGKVISIVSVIVVCIFVSAFLIIRINKQYPNPQKIVYAQGESIKGGDITIEVEKSELLQLEELVPVIPEHYLETFEMWKDTLYEEDAKALVLTIKVSNTGIEEKEMSAANFVIQSEAWSNGWDMEMYLFVNEMESMNIALGAGEEKSVQLTYLMYKSQFKKDGWEKIDERAFQLVLSTYPQKNIVELDLINKI